MRNILILAVVLTSAGIVGVLSFLHPNKGYEGKGFTRKLRATTMNEIGRLNLEYHRVYFAGLSNNKIFLADEGCSSLIVSSYNFSDTTHDNINFVTLPARRFSMPFEVKVNYPFIYYLNGIESAVFYSMLPSGQLHEIDMNGLHFTSIEPLTQHSFIAKALNRKTAQYQLMKKSKSEEYQSTLLIPHGDGRFSVDGKLMYAHEKNCIVYVYRYRNEVIVADTALNILFSSHTIDTTYVSKLKVARISSEKRVTLASPAKSVNESSCIDGEYIYICSGMIADNENSSVFRNSSVIDVYLIQDGKYEFSFYIGNFNGQKLTDFRLSKNILFALYDNHILAYRIDFN